MAKRERRGAPPPTLRLPELTPQQFVSKWAASAGRETAGYQSHFDDLCRMLGHETPAEADPSQSFFCFQKAVTQDTGRPGFADVYYRRHFGWEYKGNHKDLEAAYTQLLRYRANLENPPMLIVSDFRRIVIRTNFTNSVTRTYEIRLDDLLSGAPIGDRGLTAIELLKACFFEPEQLNPRLTPAALTEDAAKKFSRIADDLRSQQERTDDRRQLRRSYSDQQIARFLTRMIFCMFASDTGLLPPNIVTRLIDGYRREAGRLRERMADLFEVMRTGGDFGADHIPYFNGGLFTDSEALDISSDYVDALREADQLDWSEIEPSIFGTLFERILDPARRGQVGAHYTSRADVEHLVRPVLMAPLEREWEELEREVGALNLWKAGQRVAERRTEARRKLQAFLGRLGEVRVLDPACGSGNFLYVSLALLKSLEQRVLTSAANWSIAGLTPRVHPRQLYGIEIDPYAHEIASIVVWIGYLQWKRKNGIPFETETPILEPLENIQLSDAIIDSQSAEEPTWPAADVIVGNPPFLGTKKMRAGLGDEYVERLRKLYKERVPGFADLCCYWFEKARQMIAQGTAKRAGLLATQGIRGGRNRRVLERTKETGDIFFAESDRNWVLDGANVHVSMVGFDDGSETRKVLDGVPVEGINADLTHRVNIRLAKRLRENAGIGFVGDVKAGAFDVDAQTAAKWLALPNPHGKPNGDVLRPWVNGRDVTERPRGMWIVDFPPRMPIEEAARYEKPFEYIEQHVKPLRDKSKRATYRKRWWIHAEPCVAMRQKIENLQRFVATPTLTKYRLFVWMRNPTLPDHQLVVFARDDDYFFGVLHSRVHELWALAQGTQLETRPRYTPTTCFETFPMPRPTEAQEAAIAATAAELNELRENWLNPPTGSLDDAELKKRTLTNLYNQRPAWLDYAHRKLDTAVFEAYGWPTDLDDNEVLARLLALNLERSAIESGGPP